MINPGASSRRCFAARSCCQSPTRPEKLELGDPHHPRGLQPRWCVGRRTWKTISGPAGKRKGRAGQEGSSASLRVGRRVGGKRRCRTWPCALGRAKAIIKSPQPLRKTAALCQRSSWRLSPRHWTQGCVAHGVNNPVHQGHMHNPNLYLNFSAILCFWLLPDQDRDLQDKAQQEAPPGHALLAC